MSGGDWGESIIPAYVAGQPFQKWLNRAEEEIDGNLKFVGLSEPNKKKVRPRIFAKALRACDQTRTVVERVMTDWNSPNPPEYLLYGEQKSEVKLLEHLLKEARTAVKPVKSEVRAAVYKKLDQLIVDRAKNWGSVTSWICTFDQIFQTAEDAEVVVHDEDKIMYALRALPSSTAELVAGSRPSSWTAIRKHVTSLKDILGEAFLSRAADGSPQSSGRMAKELTIDDEGVFVYRTTAALKNGSGREQKASKAAQQEASQGSGGEHINMHNSSGNVCGFCGLTMDRAKVCPAWGKTCSYAKCGKKNHFVAACRKKKAD